ncbi:MAG: carboxypeptidase regulatory-like domain-containing protein [Acidobacteriia bacterium]|nr:carboxypeptidase regulatory-like domain-containing protein [Terriglobia bacterium]
MGIVVDPGDASVPGAEVQIKEIGTGMVRTFTTAGEGIFRFNNIPPGTYTVTVKMQGFKTYAQQDIRVAVAETRDLGGVRLALGALAEEISVVASATAVQTASSEKSSLVDGNQLMQIAIKGRDLMAMLNLVPGVVSTGAGEAASESSIGGVNVNGAGTSRTNFTVDGVVDLDTGSNGTTHFNPNMDSVAEVRVLTSNFQAEFGRMSSGSINVITKGGGQQFHGSGWWTWRHEQFNAKSFFDNYNNLPKSIYRYHVRGFSVGGPVFVPKVWNRARNKLFFFISQEYTKQRPATQTGTSNMPTLLERQGDFSQSFDQNGKLIQLLDPTTRAAIPGNKVPQNQINAMGLAFLNYLPLPNRCGASGAGSGCWNDPDPTQLYRRNFRSLFNESHPHRNDVARIDFSPISKLATFVRYVNDYDFDQTANGNYVNLLDSNKQWTPYSEDHPNPGHGYGVGITYTVSPTKVNEFTFGKSYNTWDWYPHDPAQLDRSKIGNPPHWYSETDSSFANDQNNPRPGLSPGSQNFANWAPGFSYGGGSTVNQFGMNPQRPYTNYNDIYSFNDNFSYMRGTHNFRFGFAYERTGKVQQAGTGNYLGQYVFGSSSSNPMDTNNGYANALMGVFQNYNEGKRVIGDFWFTNIEFYAQDSWRVSRRVTLDLGVRFYHMPSQENLNNNSAVFLQSAYDPSKAARLYYPACSIALNPGQACPSANQVAKDLVTGYTTFPALAGTLVPYSVGGYATQPNPFNGMVVADGSNPAVPLTLFTQPNIKPAFRFGLAWDVFGTGKTAVRLGFGQYYNRGDGNIIMGYGGAPPVAYNRTVYYSQIGGVPSYANSAAISPISSGGITGNQPLETVMNGSVGVQQNVGFGTVVDASWVFSLHQHATQTSGSGNGGAGTQYVNAVPMFSQYDPNNYTPWTGNLYANASGRALDSNYYRPMQGIGNVNRVDFRTTTNYHSLQVGIRRGNRHGLSYGLAYTWSKTMMYSGFPQYPGNSFFKQWYYGPSFNGAPHVIAANYIYEIPGLGKKFNIRPLGWVTDHWEVSGITSWQSHGMTGVPGISITGTSSSNPAPNWTGSAEGARLFVVGDPTVSNPTFYNNINAAAFQLPVACSQTRQTMDCFGNAGQGSIMSIPTWMNNWDVSLAKNIPIFSEKRMLTFRAEFYNLPNHTQFSGVNTSVQYDLTSYQNWIAGKGSLVQSNNQLGRYTSARNPRQVAMTLRFVF